MKHTIHYITIDKTFCHFLSSIFLQVILFNTLAIKSGRAKSTETFQNIFLNYEKCRDKNS